MRLLVNIGYQHILFDKSANYSALIEALSGATLVNESGYGESKLYTPTEGEIGCVLLPDESTKLPGAANSSGLIDRLLAAEKDRDKMNLENYQLKEKLKKIEAAHEALDTVFVK